jgi:hypothetical protein
MRNYTILLRHLLAILPGALFDELVKQYNTDYRIKVMDTWTHFTAMVYMILSHKTSLRDISYSFYVHQNKLYRLAINHICRSTLADANRTRDYRFFEALFYRVLEKCQRLTPNKPFKFKYPVHIIDATIINLCLSVFPWAKYQKLKGAIKIHTMLDMDKALPEFAVITEGKRSEMRVFSGFKALPDSIYTFDKAFSDFTWLHTNIHKKKGFFVMRLKKNIPFVPIFRKRTTPTVPVRKDWYIRFAGPSSYKAYPEPLRMIEYYDEKTDILYTFITNNRDLSAQDIAEVYKRRWDIELFFKWIKQNLKITSFIGTSKNAVYTQIWISMFVYLLLSYIKFQTRYKKPLITLFRIISTALLEPVCLIDLLHLDLIHLPRIRPGPSPQMLLHF